MEPKIRKGMQSTFHRDGTVSYWSVYDQAWCRCDAGLISDRDLAAMGKQDRTRVERATKIPRRSQ